MNRNKVINQDLSFKEYRRIKQGVPKTAHQIMEEEPETLSIDLIVKFSKDEKNIKSYRKRKVLTREMLLEYLDVNYNNDVEF